MTRPRYYKHPDDDPLFDPQDDIPSEHEDYLRLWDEEDPDA